MKKEYIKGSEFTPESVVVIIGEETYTINVNLLTCGVKDFISNKKTIKILSNEERKEILEFVKAKRDEIIHKVPVKSLSSWHDSGFNSFEEYFYPGDIVSEDLVEYFVNILPPVTCMSRYVQAGSAYSHKRDINGKYLPTYITFTKEDNTWIFVGYCFKLEKENKVKFHSNLENVLFDVNYLLGYADFKEKK